MTLRHDEGRSTATAQPLVKTTYYTTDAVYQSVMHDSYQPYFSWNRNRSGTKVYLAGIRIGIKSFGFSYRIPGQQEV